MGIGHLVEHHYQGRAFGVQNRRNVIECEFGKGGDFNSHSLMNGVRSDHHSDVFGTGDFPVVGQIDPASRSTSAAFRVKTSLRTWRSGLESAAETA